MLPTSIKNCLLGDGHVIKQKRGIALRYMSSDREYADFKRSIFSKDFPEIAIRYIEEYSGYKRGNIIHLYATGQVSYSKLGVNVFNVPTIEVLKQLNEYDLFLWYLDDGSWHKNQNTMHLYSNMLNEEETNVLCDTIESIYGIRPRIRTDRKKDGRCFYYLYYPRKLVNILHPIYKRLIEESNLPSMMYKVGGLDYVDKPAVA